MAHRMKDAPIFYQNLEQCLDKHRRNQTIMMLTLRLPRETIDFSWGGVFEGQVMGSFQLYRLWNLIQTFSHIT
ncbi:hypothetical protein BO70DRAFT_358916 [Aspergillus heteromorphus CBS 117.55]|uniref:Uncharacterized protein n=1 Tax=Aspergillus heteromorphus CBS 117.55 TaxID=1448321 RepID=A0A317X083_9EURO|nr:uncharacterized protein BO70DRAFT_358916 [Aspergillus heteromorphus CBS 117.55]PWY89900.1 hypothetical protein BO70DRAFT_358916 [Aspergillus heteromorphus CBS 117.55]